MDLPSYLTARTALLWVTPFLIILVGAGLMLRRRAVPTENAESALTPEEQTALQNLSDQ